MRTLDFRRSIAVLANLGVIASLIFLAIEIRDSSTEAPYVSLVGLNPDFEARSLEGDLLRMLDRPGFRQWWLAADQRGIPSNVVRMAEELDAMTTRH